MPEIFSTYSINPHDIGDAVRGTLQLLTRAASRCAIPIFFFHLRDGRKLLPDDTGTAFASIYEAYLDAHRAAGEIWIEMSSEAQTAGRYSFEITDAFGHHMMELPFAEVLPASNSAAPVKFAARAIAEETKARSRMLAAEIATLVITARRAVEDAEVLLNRARRIAPLTGFIS